MTFRLMTFLAIYKSYCKQIWNALKNDTKTHQNSSKIHPKSTEMVPKSAPKAILEAGRFQEGTRVTPGYSTDAHF